MFLHIKTVQLVKGKSSYVLLLFENLWLAMFLKKLGYSVFCRRSSSIDVVVQPKVNLNLFMKIRIKGNLVLRPFTDSAPCLMNEGL